MTYLLVGAVGLVLGLAAHDVAIQSLDDETKLRPFTGMCRGCRQTRGWFRLVCPRCGGRPERELIVGATSAAVAVGFHQTIGFQPELVAYLAFLTLSTALVITDLEEFRIVDRLNLGGSLVVALLLVGAAAISGEWAALWRGFGGAAAYFAGSSLLFILVRGQGFGAGDVKLAPQLGLFTAFLGWGVLGWAVFATAMIGGVLAVALVLTGTAGRKTELPYGPPMVLGAWTAIVLVGVGAIPIPT